MPDPAASADILNVVQQVLRGIVISFAAAHKTDLKKLSYLIETFGSNPALEPAARSMLHDLSAGLDVMGGKAGH